MNAHALLTSQGWRGTGHSLHPTSDLTGLSRPLLVSQKTNNLGVGKKQHKTSDMWWMNAFDKSLQGLDTSAQGKVVQRITNSGLDMVVKGGAKWVGGGGGLYACFVKGEVLGGTIELQKEEERSRSTSEELPKRKRKRDEGEVERESKEERRARKAAKRAARAAVEEIPAVEEKAETKEEKRARKAAEKALKGSAVEKESPDMEDESTSKTETKEERKERKRRKKLLGEAEKQAQEEEESFAKIKKRRKD